VCVLFEKPTMQAAAIASTISLPFLDTMVLLLIIICSFLHTTFANNTLNPSYRIHNAVNGVSYNHEPKSNVDEVDFQTLGATESYTLQRDGLKENIEIHWINSTVHEITISWNLTNVSGYISLSNVEYFTSDGKFTSHPLNGNVRNYTFVNLESGTVYTICVYMTETYGANNSTERFHSSCVKINTIEYLRRDSLIILMITLGYYVFMVLLGCTQWKRRLSTIKARAKQRSRVSEEDVHSNNKNMTMRYKDLEERERLMTTKAGCSIECNDT